MKDINRAHEADELVDEIPIHEMKVKHFVFDGVAATPSLPADVISIPLCGNMKSNIMATSKPGNVTCYDCLMRLKAIAELDSYDDALAYVKTYAPELVMPDLKIIAMGSKSGATASVIAKNKRAKTLMDSKGLKSNADVPLNMIGTRQENFYRSMLLTRVCLREEDVVDIDGDPIEGLSVGDTNKETLAMIDERMMIFAPDTE